MSNIVLLPHGETSSPDGYLTWRSCLDIIKTTVIIPSVLPRPTGGYQDVLCGPENATQKTAILVAKMLHCKSRVCPELGETIDEQALQKFAHGLVQEQRRIIAASHQNTIETLIKIMLLMSDRPYSDTRRGALGCRRFIVINTDARSIRSVEAPEKILLL